jgi:hypothetical protein
MTPINPRSEPLAVWTMNSAASSTSTDRVT